MQMDPSNARAPYVCIFKKHPAGGGGGKDTHTRGTKGLFSRARARFDYGISDCVCWREDWFVLCGQGRNL